MIEKYQFFTTFVVLFATNWLVGIDCRCGYPEMPYMSNSIESKDFFEEGERLSVSCIGSVTVGQTMRDHVIECRNNTWNTTSLRCSRIHNITAIDILLKDNSVADKKLEEREFLYLSDTDPMTCVMIGSEEKWILHLSERKYVSDVAIIASFVENRQTSGENAIAIDITVSLPNGQLCSLEERDDRPNSAIVLMVFRCVDSHPTENVSIHLKTNQNNINVCGLEVFAFISDECGKPEIPLYSYANQMRIQNGTKIAEYVCAKGYQMVGNPLRTCSPDGLWIPHNPPICEPEIKCNEYTEVFENFTFEYKDFDLFGNAIPEVSVIAYQCANRSQIIAPRTEVFCQPDGNWSQLEYMPGCHPRSHVIVMFGHHFLQDKHLIYYGASGLVILFVGSFVILFHMRRLAKKISRQMREKSYFDQEKSLPNYNTETNYQDLTNLFSQHEAVTGQAAVPAVQQTDQKY